MNDMDKNQPQTPETGERSGAPAPKKRRVNRRLRYGAASTVLTVVVIVGVVLLNVVAGILSDRYPISLDLTSDDTFTLSDESRAIAQGVSEDVQVVVFQDESYYSAPGLGSDELNTIARQFYEAMKQYNTLSGGHVTTRYINYADNPTQVSQYAKYEVSENSILFLCGERYGVTTLTNMFEYDQQSYYYSGGTTLSVTASLVEQTIATNIRKVSGDLAPVVVMTGHGEDSYTLANVKKVLGNNAYEIVECDLTTTSSITDDAITMVIPAPTTDYSAEEVVKIREWLQQGGEYSRNLVLLANYTAYCPNLYELIEEEYGIEVTREMIYETGSYYNSNYAAYGQIAENELADEQVGKKALSLYTQRLKLHRASDTDLTVSNVPLLTFGSTAQLVDLTAAGDENVKTYAADSYPVVGAAYADKQVSSPTTGSTVESVVVVYGSAYFLDDTVLTYINNAENEAMFMSVFNKISGAADATTVSSRTMSDTHLTYESAVARWVGIGVFTVVIPLAALAVGLTVFLKRRRL